MSKDLKPIADAYKDINESVEDRVIKFNFWSKESLDAVLLRTDKRRSRPETWGLTANVGLTGSGEYEWVLRGKIGDIRKYLMYVGTDELKPGQDPGEVYNDLNIPLQNDLREFWNDGWKDYWEAESELRKALDNYRSYSQLPEKVSKYNLKGVNDELKAVAERMRQVAAWIKKKEG